MGEGSTCMGNIPTAWDPLWMCCMYLHEECFPCGCTLSGWERRAVLWRSLVWWWSPLVKCNFPAKFNTYKEKNCSSCYLLASLHSQRWPCGISGELPRNTFFFHSTFSLLCASTTTCSPGVPQTSLDILSLLLVPLSLLQVSILEFIKTLALFLGDGLPPPGSDLNAGNPKCVSLAQSSFLSSRRVSSCLLDIFTWMFYAYLTLNMFSVSLNCTDVYSDKQIRIIIFISASSHPPMESVVLISPFTSPIYFYSTHLSISTATTLLQATGFSYLDSGKGRW